MSIEVQTVILLLIGQPAARIRNWLPMMMILCRESCVSKVDPASLDTRP